jgi:hypothetical protein
MPLPSVTAEFSPALASLHGLDGVNRRFQTWCRNEILRQVLTDIANELRD